MKKIIKGIILFCVALGACNKDDEMPTTLVVKTMDINGAMVPGVNVELYPTLEDWLSETEKVYETLVTDENGVVTFMNMDTGAYYINAYKDLQNNWEAGVKKQIVGGFENTTNIEISENNSFLLSNATGKRWILNSIFTNGQDSYSFLDDCIKDDTLTFFKGPATGAYNVSRGALKCSVFQEDDIPGIWTISNNGGLLQIQLGQDILNWNIDTLKVDKLIVTYTDAGNVQNVGYIPAE